MRAIKRLSVLGLLLGLAFATSSCSYFHATSAAALYNKGVELQKQKNMDGALAAYDELIETYGKDAANPDIADTLCSGMHNELLILRGMPSTQQRVIAAVDREVSICSADSSLKMRTEVAGSMYDQSVAYDQLNRHTEATPILAKVVDSYANDSSPKIRRIVAVAMCNLGLHQVSENRLPEAASVFRRLISTYAGDKEPDIREQRVKAIYNLGVVLEHTQQLQEAISTYQQAIDIYATSKNPEERKEVLQSLERQAVLYQQQNRSSDAVADYLQMINVYAPGTTPAERRLIATGGIRLGEIQMARQDSNGAAKLYGYLIRTYSSDSGSIMHGLVASAMQGQALALEARSPDEALAVFEKLVNTYGDESDDGIRWIVGFSLNAAADKHRMIAKREWKDRARAQAELHAAQDELKASLVRIPNRSWTLGNLAYVQWLLGDQAAAAQSFASALDDPENGGATIYKDTLGDIARFPIREDAGFRKMIEQEWSKYGTRHPGPGLS